MNRKIYDFSVKFDVLSSKDWNQHKVPRKISDIFNNIILLVPNADNFSLSENSRVYFSEKRRIMRVLKEGHSTGLEIHKIDTFLRLKMFMKDRGNDHIFHWCSI